jgi:hypothetical protein
MHSVGYIFLAKMKIITWDRERRYLAAFAHHYVARCSLRDEIGWHDNRQQTCLEKTDNSGLERWYRFVWINSDPFRVANDSGSDYCVD